MTTSAPRIGFVSLGCPKNLTDSEAIVTRLAAEGYQVGHEFEGAQLVIVNTCGFIDEAVQESLDNIGEALATNGRVIVTGCLGAEQRAGGSGADLIRRLHPSVLAVTGPQDAEAVMDAVHQHCPKPANPFTDLVPAARNEPGEAGIKLTPRHYAYLKISEGCNHHCTFCIIPSMRGALVSRPIGQILREAQALFERGVKELIVVSQDTSAYGLDVRYRTGFWDGRPIKTRLLELARALAQLAAQHRAWVRLHYLYPYPQVDDIVALMAEGGILPYLDAPLQHSHPDVLRRMRRPASGEKHLERIAHWRSICPQLAIRSSFIVGFPGETEAEFEHLLDFIRAARIERAGCFAYSPVEGAAANALPGALPDEVREERRARFMEVAEAITAECQRERIGSEMKVLIDHAPALGRKGAVGRSYADAPEIDGTVRLLPPKKISTQLRTGQFARVRITDADGADLIGEPI